MVTIPRELYLFLMGEGSLDGTWFGDNPIRGVAKGRFWWRSMLQRCITRPTADLGEDGELVERLYRHSYKLPDGYYNGEDFGCNAESPESLIMAELDSGPRGTDVMQVLTAYDYTIVETGVLNQVRDRLILYREALENIAGALVADNGLAAMLSETARAVLSRSGG